MPRIHIFMCGIKSDILSFINSHPQLVVRTNQLWEYPRLFVRSLELGFIVVQQHQLVYQLIPEIDDWKLVCKVIRRIKNAAPSNVKVVSARWIKQNYPNVAREILCPPIFDENGDITGYDTSIERYPMVITGDAPEDIINYDPTQDDIDNDTDPDPVELGIEEVQP